MNVLAPGKEAEELRGRCNVCGCELECHAREAQRLEVAPADVCYAVRCPTATCGKWVYLRAKDGGLGPTA